MPLTHARTHSHPRTHLPTHPTNQPTPPHGIGALPPGQDTRPDSTFNHLPWKEASINEYVIDEPLDAALWRTMRSIGAALLGVPPAQITVVERHWKVYGSETPTSW